MFVDAMHWNLCMQHVLRGLAPLSLWRTVLLGIASQDRRGFGSGIAAFPFLADVRVWIAGRRTLQGSHAWCKDVARLFAVLRYYFMPVMKWLHLYTYVVQYCLDDAAAVFMHIELCNAILRTAA